MTAGSVVFGRLDSNVHEIQEKVSVVLQPPFMFGTVLVVSIVVVDRSANNSKPVDVREPDWTIEFSVTDPSGSALARRGGGSAGDIGYFFGHREFNLNRVVEGDWSYSIGPINGAWIATGSFAVTTDAAG